MTVSDYHCLLLAIRAAFPGMAWLLNATGNLSGSVSHSLSCRETVTFAIVGDAFECSYESERLILVTRSYKMHAPLLEVITHFHAVITEESL